MVFANIGQSIVQGIIGLFWNVINGIKNLFVSLITWIAVSIQHFFENTLNDIFNALESAGQAIKDHSADTVQDLVGGFQEDRDKIAQLLPKLAEKGELPLQYYLHSLDLEVEFDYIDSSLTGTEIYGGALLALSGLMLLIWIGAAFSVTAIEVELKSWGEKLDKRAKKKDKRKPKRDPDERFRTKRKKKRKKRPGDYVVQVN